MRIFPKLTLFLWDSNLYKPSIQYGCGFSFLIISTNPSRFASGWRGSADERSWEKHAVRMWKVTKRCKKNGDFAGKHWDFSPKHRANFTKLEISPGRRNRHKGERLATFAFQAAPNPLEWDRTCTCDNMWQLNPWRPRGKINRTCSASPSSSNFCLLRTFSGHFGLLGQEQHLRTTRKWWDGRRWTVWDSNAAKPSLYVMYTYHIYIYTTFIT